MTYNISESGHFFIYEKITRFKKCHHLPGARRTMAWHYHKSDTPTFISLINVESRLLILKNKIHPPHTFPPSTFIDFLNFFHVYSIYVLVCSKNSQPPLLFQSPCLLSLQFLTPSLFIPTSSAIREMRVLLLGPFMY